jgi:hypothetical protein
MLVTIEALDDIARRCLAGEGLSGEQMSWLGKSLGNFLAHRCHSIDEALGLKWGRGGVPWWLEKAIRRRDAALRELAHRFFGELSVSAQARAIRTLSIRYAAAAWRFDKQLEAPPARYAGTPQEWLWHAFASDAPMPIGERQLRYILPSPLSKSCSSAG